MQILQHLLFVEPTFFREASAHMVILPRGTRSAVWKHWLDLFRMNYCDYLIELSLYNKGRTVLLVLRMLRSEFCMAEFLRTLNFLWKSRQ